MKARSIDIIDNGKLAAVGFRDGAVRIFSLPNWNIIETIHDRKEWISDVKFSPGKKYLAVGTHDNPIDIYNVSTMKKKCVLKSSTSFINHIDWSVDGGALKSNDASYEILYYDVESKK